QLTDAALEALARFVGARPEDLALVPNASSGVSTVVRSLRFAPGDELLTTSHAYNSCRNALEFVAERDGAKVVAADVPFPLRGEQDVEDAILSKVTARTRFALVDHMTSPTGLMFPVAHIVRRLEERGVDTLVDGAHVVGMLPLNVE